MEPRRSKNGLGLILSRINFPLLGMMFTCIVLCSIIWTSVRAPVPIGAANVPTRHADGKVHIHDMNALSSTSQPEANNEKVLVVTPLVKFYGGWWDNLISLNYPHELIDLGIIVPNNALGDTVLKQLNVAVNKLQNSPKKFRRITILRQDTETMDTQQEKDRHAMHLQKQRRRDMSLARNSLVFTTMQSDTSWVLWIDGDVIETPASLIQDLTSHNKDVIVANCWQRYTEGGEVKERPYDLNSWVDSSTAQELGETLGPDDILLEGYGEMPTYRTLMAKFRDVNGDKSTLMELDGVGGTALLVKADVHRDGAMFPPFAFYHLIETEGFAKMVKRLGYEVFGLPNYVVYHYNE